MNEYNTVQAAHDLPYTGVSLVAWVVFFLLVLAAGVAIRWAVTR